MRHRDDLQALIFHALTTPNPTPNYHTPSGQSNFIVLAHRQVKRSIIHILEIHILEFLEVACDLLNYNS